MADQQASGNAFAMVQFVNLANTFVGCCMFSHAQRAVRADGHGQNSVTRATNVEICCSCLFRFARLQNPTHSSHLDRQAVHQSTASRIQPRGAKWSATPRDLTK
eukprot:4375699-Amphidinium_carterae.1